MSLDELSASLGRTAYGVRQKMDRMGLYNPHKFTKYISNDSFWSVPNPINSYWAGFIAADGCVRKQGNSYSLMIQLQEEDKGHLEKFLSACGSTNIIATYLRPTSIKKDKFGNYCDIRITNNKWQKDLESNFNIFPAKTWNFSPPSLSEGLIPYWVAGFIDGDGCYNRVHNGHLLITITSAVQSSLDVVFNLFDKYKRQKGAKQRNIRKCGKNKQYFNFSVSGHPASEAAMFIMGLPCPHLERKYRKAAFVLQDKYNISLPPYEENQKDFLPKTIQPAS